MVDVYFLDSSALLKRYVPEIGSALVQSITDPQNQNRLFVAHVTWVEVCSAVARRQREGSVSDVHANQILMAFRVHWDAQYFTAAIDETIIELAGQLVKKHPLRAYDAVQLAAALSIRNEIKLPSGAAFHFLTADDRLLAIAQAENLLVDNPNWHP
jgi:uncharacterized protein